MRLGFIFSVALTFSLGAGAAQSAPAPAPPQIQTQDGAVQGAWLADGTAIFRGLPFAAPPVGALRWRPPAPVVPWVGVAPAIAKAPSCPQTSYGGWNDSDAKHGREDCLYLDVRSPSLRAAARLPVMVWVHGGGNRAGSMSDAVLSSLGGRGVVLVAIQYRLGALGFMSHAALSAETPDHTSGNYGLMDQVAALRWVHDNIARFGGDPTNVTLFGESAGAQDVGLMVVADASRGLFQKAIEQSGTADFGLPPRSLAQSEQVGETVAMSAGAPADASAAQLRALPVPALLAAAETAQVPGLDDSSFIWLQAVVDGRVLKRSPVAILQSGEQRRVPLIIGSNARELNLHGDDVRAAVKRLYGAHSSEALRLYGLDAPTVPASDPRLGDVATQLADDVTFRCPSGEVANAQARAGSPVWRYQYDVTPAEGAVAHGSDIGSVFNARPVTPAGTRPSFSLQDYWVAFAQSGDPNRVGLPLWPRFTTASQDYLVFQDQGPAQKSQLRAPFCRLLDNY